MSYIVLFSVIQLFFVCCILCRLMLLFCVFVCMYWNVYVILFLFMILFFELIMLYGVCWLLFAVIVVLLLKKRCCKHGVTITCEHAYNWCKQTSVVLKLNKLCKWLDTELGPWAVEVTTRLSFIALVSRH